MDDLELFSQKLSLADIKTEMVKHERVECPVTHHFAEGQYARETLMPAGTMVLGKKHKQSTLNILLQGKLLVYNGEGSELKELSAPCVYTTDAGVQKLAYIIEDVRWLNCVPTEETDPDVIEDKVTFKEDEKCLT